MGLIRSITGSVRVEILSADIPGLLAALAEREITMLGVVTQGDLTVRMEILRKDYRALSKLCGRRGEKLRILSRRGLYWVGKGAIKRPLLLSGMAAGLLLMMFLPTRVLFVRVEGNETIAANQILEAAEASGISFGASRREVKSERVKNSLLEALPQLKWAGVNTYGCVAVISVTERQDTQVQAGEKGVSSIIAGCDGVILSATVTAGNGLCQPGQAVTEGQVLISGYTNLGLTIAATRAEGEVYARTRHQLRAITPVNWLCRGEIQEEKVNYSVIIGKNRINLWKGSGIWEGSCGRMYEEYYITLPGGFQLPLALVKETITWYDTQETAVDAEEAGVRLTAFGETYLRGQMISGIVEQSVTSVTETNGAYMLQGEYFCTEMIGRVRQEKIGE